MQFRPSVLQQFQRPFTNTSSLSFRRPSPRWQAQNDSPYSPRSAPNPNTPHIVAGSIVLACAGVFAANWKWEIEARKGSHEAIQWLRTFRRNMVFSMDNIKEGRYWVYLTSTFTHISGLHLILNMMSFWSFGPMFVAQFGTRMLAILWVGSGVVGAFAQERLWKQANTHINQAAVGASGSILGICTALTCVMPRMRVEFFWIPMPMWSFMAGAAVFSITAINQGWLPFVGHADHLGGMAFGLVWGLAVLRRRTLLKFPAAPKFPRIPPR